MRTKTAKIPERFNTTNDRAAAERWVAQAQTKYGEPFVLLATHRAAPVLYTVQPKGRWEWASRLSPCEAMRVFGWALCPDEAITAEVVERMLNDWRTAYPRAS